MLLSGRAFGHKKTFASVTSQLTTFTWQMTIDTGVYVSVVHLCDKQNQELHPESVTCIKRNF